MRCAGRGLTGLLAGLGLLVASDAGAATATRSSAFEYDPVSGILTKEIVEPDQAQFRLETAYTLDAFGHRAAATVSSPATGLAVIEPRVASSGYDAQGRFATSATNALGHTETRVFDARFGAAASITEPNGLAITWTYDGFGRKTSETRPDGTKTTWDYLLCTNVPGGTAACPPFAAYVVVSTPLAADGATVNGPVSKSYMDPLNREVRAETQGFAGTPVYVDTEYDDNGRILKKSRPYFSTDTAVYWTVFEYDALGRVITEIHPDDSPTTYSRTTLIHAGLTTTATNALGQFKRTTKNVQGQIAAVTEGKAGVLTATTSYAYDPHGNLIQTTDAAGNVTTLEYDVRGRKIATNDPNMGRWTYVYDALGQFVQQTDAKSQVTSQAYDKLGRLVSRTEPDLVSAWTYDTAAHGIGKLAQARATDAAGAPVHQRDHTYDSLGRPAGTAIAIAGTAPYSFANTYDTHGRLETVAYPSGFAARYTYNGLGFLKEVKDNATNHTYWTIESLTADGQLKQALSGNGRRNWHDHDPATGRITAIQTWSGVQGLSYVWDPVGNLVSRTDHVYSFTESFTYDALNRVTSATGRTTKTVQYDLVGNITYKSDTGTYVYPAPGAGVVRPNAVQSITGALNATYAYDANGNMISGAGRTITWTSYNTPASIGQGSSTLAFLHDTDHQRIRQVAPDGTTLYLNDPGSGVKVEKVVGTTGTVQWNDYIWIAGEMVAVVYKRDAGGTLTTLTRYFHKDHLGSTQVITDEAGAKLEHLSYDIWGKRRLYNGWDDTAGTVASLTDKGFTGHEHLEEVGLIHMNGRVYDPQIGRFLSADPVVQNVFDTQALNRFTYARNNPLAYVDPDGFIFKKIKKAFKKLFKAVKEIMRNPVVRAVVVVAAAAVVYHYAFYALTSQFYEVWTVAEVITAKAMAAGAAGFTGGVIAGGDVESGVKGAITAIAFVGVGEIASSLRLEQGSLEKVALHATAGGATSSIGGGDFKSGFLSAGFSQAVGPSLPNFDRIGNALSHAVVGGTASVIGGGKFANGAATAGFAYLFNDGLHPNNKRMATSFDRSEWETVGYVSGSYSSVEFYAGDQIAVEAWSVASPATNQFRFNVNAIPTTEYGQVIPSLAPEGWSSPSQYSSGFTGNGDPNQFVFEATSSAPLHRWMVSIPPQEAAHDNKFHDTLIVYRPRGR